MLLWLVSEIDPFVFIRLLSLILRDYCCQDICLSRLPSECLNNAQMLLACENSKRDKLFVLFFSSPFFFCLYRATVKYNLYIQNLCLKIFSLSFFLRASFNEEISSRTETLEKFHVTQSSQVLEAERK